MPRPTHWFPEEIPILALMKQCQNIKYAVPSSLKNRNWSFNGEIMTPFDLLDRFGVFRGRHAYQYRVKEFRCRRQSQEKSGMETNEVVLMCVMRCDPVTNSAVVRAYSSSSQVAINACGAKLIFIYSANRSLARKTMHFFKDSSRETFTLFSTPRPISGRPEKGEAPQGIRFVPEKDTLFPIATKGHVHEIEDPRKLDLDSLFVPLQPIDKRKPLSKQKRATLFDSQTAIPPLEALKFCKVLLELSIRSFPVRREATPSSDQQFCVVGCSVKASNRKDCNLFVQAFADSGAVAREVCAALFLYQYFGDKLLAVHLLTRWLATLPRYSLYEAPRPVVNHKDGSHSIAESLCTELPPKINPVKVVPVRIGAPEAVEGSVTVKGKTEDKSLEDSDIKSGVKSGYAEDDANSSDNSIVEIETESASISSNIVVLRHRIREQMEELSNNSFVESVEVVRCAVGVESGRLEVELCVNNRHSFVATSPPPSSTLSSDGCGVEAAFSAVLAEALGVMGRMQRQGSPHCVIAATTPDLALLASLLQDHSGLSLDSLHLRFQFLFPSKSWVAILTMDGQTFCSKDTHNNQTDALKEVLLTFLVENLKFEQI